MSVHDREDPTDAQLLAETHSDPEAFARFYERYERSIVGYFMRRTADLTAETFAAALKSARRYRQQHPTAAAWLFTIAANVLAKSARRGRVEDRARRQLGIRKVALREESVARVEASASDDWVAELLERLPTDQRDAIVARILEDRSYEDIASELSTSELVVRKRVSRALATLREQLERPT